MSADPDTIFETIAFTLNGESVEALPGETIIQTAKRTGTEIPHLCYTEGLRSDGNLPCLCGRNRWRTCACPKLLP